MKGTDSRGMVIAPVTLFIGVSASVFLVSLYFHRRIGLVPALLPLLVTMGAAAAVAVILARRNKAEVMFSRDDLGGKRRIGVICGAVAASLWLMYAASFADSDWVRLQKLGVGLLIGAAAYFAAMGVCAAVLFVLEVARIKAKRTGVFLAAVLVALTGGVLLGCALSSALIKPVILGEKAFLSDLSAVREDDLVEYGVWPQNGSEPEPIVWRVIETGDGALTLMSEYALETSYYYFDTCEYFTYRESAVRDLVSGEFPAAAFTEEERARLLPQPVGGGEEDFVTILTLTQAAEVFGASAECPATENVKAKIPSSEAGDCAFFVRPNDPDDTDVYLYCLMPVKTEHTIRMRLPFEVDEHGVRPVIRIRTEG